jgi:hypothetical protein
MTATGHIDSNIVRLGMAETTPFGIWYLKFLEGPAARYKVRFLEWENEATRTQIIIEKMAEAEEEFVPAFRELYHLMVANPLATDADLTACGFPKRRSGGNTPAPVATEIPGFTIIPLTGNRIRIDFYPIGAGEKDHKGKPKGQHGVEIKWGFSDVPVLDPTELDHSEIDTSSPYTFTFSANDRGKTIYLALRWENTRGLKGPWSPVESAVIP